MTAQNFFARSSVAMGCSLSSPVVSMQVRDRDTGSMLNETVSWDGGGVKKVRKTTPNMAQPSLLLSHFEVPSYLRSVYRLMYQNPIGRKLIKFPVTTAVLRRATARHGVKMDDPLSAKEIEKFIATYGVNVEEAELSLDQYLTFNEFFCRKLKAGVRPIAAPHDNHVLVAPADCRLLVYPSIEDTTKLWLKGQDFTIAQLLGPQQQHMLEHFHQPAIAIARLAPQDYHRWHMPLAATVGARQSIAGTYFSVSPRAVREVNILCTNKREVCFFESSDYGHWCMIAVGAAMVSSIDIAPSMTEGTQAAKGDEHGWFRFGGSTLILIFDAASVVFDADLISASRKPIETYVKVGTQIGRSRRHAKEQQDHARENMNIEATHLDESPSSIALMPSPSSPSLIYTATTDSARKEAHLNDEGLLSDLPTMSSNLTLLSRSDSDSTMPARGVPATTKARDDAAEAAGGERRSSLLPSFLTASSENDDGYDDDDKSNRNPPDLQRTESSSPVPAPRVFHLMRLPNDDDDDDEGDEGEVEEEENEVDDDHETDGLMDESKQGEEEEKGGEDEDQQDHTKQQQRKKQFAHAKYLQPPTESHTHSSSSSS